MDKLKLDKIPTDPGVYLMKNQEGIILYVGKAKNLRQRVKQYFIPGGDGRPMIPFLMSQVVDIETIILSSEKEALLFESTLIKRHQPKYNALFKDDKSYIAIKVTKHHWPMLQLVRYKGQPKPDGLYFGPYTSAQNAREMLDVLQRMIPLRECSDQELARRTRPCILYDMKRCVAPCVEKCTKEEYDSLVKQAIQFLRGQNQELINHFYEKMKLASDSLDFERAADILKTIQSIEKTLEQQHVDKPLGIDADALGIFREGEEVWLSQLIYKSGRLIDVHHYSFTNIAETDEELFISFLMQHYDPIHVPPREIIIPINLPEIKSLQELLASTVGYKVEITVPQRGDKKQLIEMAQANASSAFKRGKDQQAIREKALLEMQEKFGLNKYPKRIECVDNSHLSGSELVSAIVSFNEGEKETKNYRTYKMRTASFSDDYAALYEVLTRHLKRSESHLPDLLIIDGGRGHLNIAVKVLEELNITTVDLISVAKEEARHDKGLTAERIFLPQVKDPIQLSPNSQILFFIQRIRDEAHRFVIGFQKKRRSKIALKTVLDDIPGIGPIKKKRLLRHFGSLKKIQEATIEEISQVSTFSQKNAEEIWTFFHTYK